ncbi:hypothetical protein Fmac_032372 [Flemingia macrophylla]|uniref:RNase H type-1 domain-containing protein n=1 Tax=Flemingia macrophylla TaxID=520843 RepID=A0ABD1L4T6_9FABA
MHNQVQAIINSLTIEHDLLQATITHSSQIQGLHWIKPPQGVYKLNCDAALSREGVGACGCILRNAVSEMIFALASQLTPQSILKMELWAILYGIRLMKDELFVGPYIMETDSSEAVRMIQMGCGHPYDCAEVIHRLQEKYLLREVYLSVGPFVGQVGLRGISNIPHKTMTTPLLPSPHKLLPYTPNLILNHNSITQITGHKSSQSLTLGRLRPSWIGTSIFVDYLCEFLGLTASLMRNSFYLTVIAQAPRFDCKLKEAVLEKFTIGFDVAQTQVEFLYPDLDLFALGYFKEINNEDSWTLLMSDFLA